MGVIGINRIVCSCDGRSKPLSLVEVAAPLFREALIKTKNCPCCDAFQSLHKAVENFLIQDRLYS